MPVQPERAPEQQREAAHIDGATGRDAAVGVIGAGPKPTAFHAHLIGTLKFGPHAAPMRRASEFLGDRRGATAVEFALVGSMFIMTVLFVLMVAAIAYINQALDYATNRAARQILTGNAQSQVPAASLATFTQSLCGYLPAAITCANVIVNLYVVTKASQPGGYYTYVKSDMSGLAIPTLSAGSGQFNIGVQGDYQYLQVIYPITFLPSGFASMLSGGVTYNGKPAYLAISTAAFRNEQYASN